MTMEEDGDDNDDGYTEMVIIMKTTVAMTTVIMARVTAFPERLRGSVTVSGTLCPLSPIITIIL